MLAKLLAVSQPATLLVTTTPSGIAAGKNKNSQMKKLFVLTALLLGISLSSNAQIKKTWDFTLGLSEETVENLNADATNWAANGTDDNGVTNNWKNHAKHSASEPWAANGVEIAELRGLLIDIGSNGDNSLHLAQSKLRLTRNNTTITFPKLANGQRVTIVGRSANGDAGGSKPHRYIEAASDNLTLVQGTQTDGKCSFVGNKVEGSLGTYSFTWEVKTDATDSVEVKFKLPSAGIDFTLFQIDEGDVPQVAQVALLTANGGDTDVLAILKSRENTEVTAINVDDIPTDYMEAAKYATNLQETYDVVVIGASVPASHSAGSLAKSALPYMPVLNLNADIYSSWGTYLYGEPKPAAPFARITNKKHNLFKGISAEEFIEQDGITAVPISNGAAETVTGIKLGSYFEGDDIPAAGMEDDETAIIHTHNINHNGYVYFPYVSDYTPTAAKIISNAITILANSKAPTTAAPAPIISREYKNNATVVTITPARKLPKTRILYTLDGSEPGYISTQYTEPITITEPCTIKAVADAEGYNKSAVAEMAIKVKQQPEAPKVSIAEGEGETIVTLSSNEEFGVVYYNFDGNTDTIKSSKYVEPFAIKMPATLTTFVVDTLERGDEVWSEVVEKRVLVRNPRVVIDVAAHFGAAQWSDVSNNGGVFSWGKSAQSMYDTTAEPTTTVDPETGDEVTVYPELEGETRDEPGDDPQWMLTSKGQAMIWQSLTAQTGQIGTNEGGYFPSVAEDIDPLFPITSYDVQFYQIFAGEKPNATIQTKGKYQAPLDVVTIANLQGGPLSVQVSTDGKEWQTVGEEIEKTGYTRMWKKYTNSYNGTDEVYVRVAQLSGSDGAKVFDIYIANAGDKSKALLDELNAEYAAGIEDVEKSPVRSMKGVYNLSGVRQAKLQRGLNIVVDADGKAKKVLVK